MRCSYNHLRIEYPVYTPLIPTIATSRTSLNQTLVGTMGPIQFVCLAILAAMAGVIAVPIYCIESFIYCPDPVLVEGCWTCKIIEG